MATCALALMMTASLVAAAPVMSAQRRPVSDRHVRRDFDHDIDEPAAAGPQQRREAPDQTRTRAAVERLVFGQSRDDFAQVVRLRFAH